MIVEVPILIQPRPEDDPEGSLYSVRPLFFSSPEAVDHDLSIANRRLENMLREHLQSLVREGELRQLSHFSFSPDVTLHWLDLKLELNRGMERCPLVAATFVEQERTLAFLPHLCDLWYEVGSANDIWERTNAVLTQYLRDLERKREFAEVQIQLSRLRMKRRPSLSVLDIEISTRVPQLKNGKQQFAMLQDVTAVDGAAELRRVGRSLHAMYPHQLVRAVQRDELVQTLTQLLAASDNRPVLLVGRPLVGKTTLVHEVVFRDMAARSQGSAQAHVDRGQFWRIAPQRLVTGMSYVGQWENRWLAILQHASKKKHVLYFDDLVALFQAGVTSQSNLSAADVLQPYVERREVRLLAEMTPEQLRLLRERDRGFADMFQIVSVGEPSEEATVITLLEVIRRLETSYRVQCDLEVLPTVMDLTRRFQPAAAFPGKAATWLTQLAVKYRGRAVQRQDVMQEFHRKSGLQLNFLDTREQLSRQEIARDLHQRIIGQEDAVEAMVDVVSVAKARLNDPHRPLGSLFFLGPTGVGKTECAKALAAYLFGEESRLLRFDMNEYVSAQAATRLVGTIGRPEGLLTSAVRHQPFCVLLFDEIEKAHPDVFDLLLQVLGEARLTESLGRTTDFSNAVIILTSNLGTRDTSQGLGFGGGDDRSQASTLEKAVRDFFRPEFFNRLDRIVPFRQLSREELGRIAESLVLEATGRHGLRRRKCVVDISADARERMIDRGFDGALGARAMRRAVEHELVAPLARQLAAVVPDTPTVLEVSVRDTHLNVRVTPLVQTDPWPETGRGMPVDVSNEHIARAHSALDRITHTCIAARPEGEIVAGNVEPQFAWYLGLMELIQDTRALLRHLVETRQTPTSGVSVPVLQSRPGRRSGKITRYGRPRDRRVLKELYAAEDVRQYCQELMVQLQRLAPAEILGVWLELLDRLALLEAIKPEERGWPHERTLLIVRSPGGDPGERKRFMSRVTDSLSWRSGDWQMARTITRDDGMSFGLEWSAWPPHPVDQSIDGESAIDGLPAPAALPPDLQLAVLEGPSAQRLARLHEGTHLVVACDGRFFVYQVMAFPLRDAESVDEVLERFLTRDVIHRATPAGPEEMGVAGSYVCQPVVTMEDESSGLCLDFRYERAIPGGWVSLSRLLSVPPELQDC